MLICAEDLSCLKSGLILFEGLSFSINMSELVHVEGRNGSGKTSLLRIIAGLDTPAQGQVKWASAERREKQMLYLGHCVPLKDELTPEENLSFFASLYQIKVPHQGILEALDFFEAAAFSDVLCRFLSAGQKRRVALAKLRLSAARLWVLDEPFTSLDRQNSQKLLACFEAHLVDQGAILLTSHHEISLANKKIRLS